MSFSEIINYLREPNIISALFRLTLATICGGFIGIERIRKRRPAGFRTHTLVCIGSALTMIISQYLWSIGQTTDLSRLGAQVINGIGFLGAGTIIVTGKQQVKGMTTAAGLWASACMGLGIGAGFYLAALICCVLIIVTIVVFSRMERFILSRSRNINVYVEFEDTEDLSAIISTINANQVRIFDVEVTKAKYSENHYPHAIFSLQLPKKTSHTVVMTALARIETVRSLEEL